MSSLETYGLLVLYEQASLPQLIVSDVTIDTTVDGSTFLIDLDVEDLLIGSDVDNQSFDARSDVPLLLDSKLPAIEIETYSGLWFNANFGYVGSKLPVLAGEMAFGENADGGGTLPVMSSSGYFGWSLSDTTLPTLSLLGELSYEETMSLSLSLPSVEIASGVFGLRGAGQQNLPTPSLSANIDDRTLSLDKTIPIIGISGLMVRGAIGVDGEVGFLDLSKPLPAIRVSANASTDGLLWIDETLPVITLSSHGTPALQFSLSEILPVLSIDASAGGYNYSIAAYLPVIGMMRGGVAGEYFDLEDDLVSATTTILRHSR